MKQSPVPGFFEQVRHLTRVSKKLLMMIFVAAGVLTVTAVFFDATFAKGEKGVNAPEFPQGLEWLNVEQPLTMAELRGNAEHRGKIVLLDFWTYCCINCMHIIPDLKKLEEKYPNELVVIGVHSAKFLTEKGTENIRQAVLRYGIEHPVVNDKDFQVWKLYGVSGWPTVVLIDPAGKIVDMTSGEGIYEAFDLAIAKLVLQFGKSIDQKPLQLALEKDKAPATVLRFPGKILADEASKQLFVVDSNHNRILVADFEGTIHDTIGSGSEGWKDGSFEEAEFLKPQGITLYQDALYIADTENHLVRKADLKAKAVTTIAGVGKQVYARDVNGDAKLVGLNSPWDLVVVKDILYIAMAGPHQLWALDLKTNQIHVHAGSGVENIIDGPLRASALAQPSGITSDGTKLYFADSEVSAIRMADIQTSGRVETIIGHGLFDFGDIDGGAVQARFQHPLGVVQVDGKLYVADTYNNKIKLVDPRAKTSQTFAGSGQAVLQDGAGNDASFNEPGGISYAAGKLYVADTNNHAVRIVDLKTKAVSTLEITEPEQPATKISFSEKEFQGEKVKVDGVNWSALKALEFEVVLPKGHKVNLIAKSALRVFDKDGKVIVTQPITVATFTVPFPQKEARETLYAELVIYHCTEDMKGQCYLKNVLFEIPYVESNRVTSLKIRYPIR